MEQFAFDFNLVAPRTKVSVDSSVDDRVQLAALDYQLQMQAYVLAVRELAPFLSVSKISATLHFLEPNVEFQLSDDLLRPEVCKQAIDEAIANIVSSGTPEEFPVHTAAHCRRCNFLTICRAGREWVRAS